MPFASEQEIREAHDILLNGLPDFDDARKDVIMNNSSCYVQACPGSGKTTTLLAKLIILANRMPFPDGKGICVLTHTNVAIDEIKAKLGQKADILFRYPNFFGTIQTFLHKYVAAAALHYYYDSQITYVDDDIANSVLIKKFNQLQNSNKLKKYIYANTISKEILINDEDIASWGGIDVLASANIIEKKGSKKPKCKLLLKNKNYIWTNIPRNIKSLIQLKIRSVFETEGRKILLAFKIDWANHKIITDQKPMRIETESGAEYLRIKEEMYKEGILTFQDAYDLALRYIKDKELDFRNISDKRFHYLFIDEVQDCNNTQVELINRIFADNKVIVQRFGDYCQAIYDSEGSDDIENEKLKDNEVLRISNSNRFGENIAKPLRTICMEDNSQLIGSAEVSSAKPIIIAYEDPLDVLPKYEELLNSVTIPAMGNRSILDIADDEKQKDPLHRINVKACGWVGKKGASQQKRFIESYFPKFEKKSCAIRNEYETFNDFIANKAHDSAKEYASSIIQGILKFLDLCDVKNVNRRYTKTSLLEFLISKDSELKDKFLTNIMNWALLLSSSDTMIFDRTKATIYQYITDVLLPLFDKEMTEEANRFFSADNIVRQDNHIISHDNIYHGSDIDIEVATVHAVKGETHVSTLFMETSFNRKHESERLADQFKGLPYTQNDKNNLTSLKVAYVAMSRPRYLLCVAVQKDRFMNIDCPELRNIWDVVEI